MILGSLKVTLNRVSEDCLHLFDKFTTFRFNPAVVIFKCLGKEGNRIRQDREIIFTFFVQEPVDDVEDEQTHLQRPIGWKFFSIVKEKRYKISIHLQVVVSDEEEHLVIQVLPLGLIICASSKLSQTLKNLE